MIFSSLIILEVFNTEVGIPILFGSPGIYIYTKSLLKTINQKIFTTFLTLTLPIATAAKVLVVVVVTAGYIQLLGVGSMQATNNFDRV